MSDEVSRRSRADELDALHALAADLEGTDADL